MMKINKSSQKVVKNNKITKKRYAQKVRLLRAQEAEAAVNAPAKKTKKK